MSAYDDSPEYADFRMDQRGCLHCGSPDSHRPGCVHYGEGEDELPMDRDDEEHEDEIEHRMPWSDDDVPDGGGP